MQTRKDEEIRISVDVKDTSWYQAVTLPERIALSHPKDKIRGTQTGDRELAEWRLKRWYTMLNEKTLFEQRLAMDDITEEELLLLLGETASSVRDRFSGVPDWLESIHRAFSVAETEQNSFSQQELLTKLSLQREVLGQKSDTLAGMLRKKEWRGIELLSVAEPLVRQGCERLERGIQGLCFGRTNLPFDSNTVEQIFLPNLLPRLLEALTRTLALELNVARLRGLLAGDTPKERYEHFVRHLSQPDGSIDFLREYPVLARHLTIRIDQWVEQSLVFLERLDADWDEICRIFSPASDPGILKQVAGGMGDSHQGGQSVMLLTFTSDLQVMYKPRPLKIDVHFQELLLWLNGRGDHPPFKIMNILDRGKYGWVECVKMQNCTEREEVQRFYLRQGAYLALLYVLQATDFHYENLIAAGEHPVLIDLESLFHPHVEMPVSAVDTAESLAGDALIDSVIRVMLLPHRAFANADSEGIEVSGLGGAAGQLTPDPILQIEDFNMDTLHFARKRVEMPGSHNRPQLNGNDVNVQEYTEELIAGFINMYRLLLNHRVAFLADDGPLADFIGDEIRVIVRATFMYSRLLQESFHPDVLRDALDRDMLFDTLWKGTSQRPLLARVIASERADLQRGDIPMFTTCTNSIDLWNSFGERLPNFCETSGLDIVRSCIQRLSEKDLEKQLWFIRASLATLSMGVGLSAPQYSPFDATTTASREQLIAAASSIGDRLLEQALRGQNDTTWIGLSLIGERTWYLTPLGAELYNGLPGVILFLAYLGKLTGEERYAKVAQAALVTMNRQLEGVRSSPAIGIGAFSGLGGIIYVLVHLARLWDDLTLLTQAESLVKLLPPLIEKDEIFDIVGGASGCIAGLLSLYRSNPSKEILAAMTQCGDVLLAHAQQMQTGVGWVTTIESPQPLTGFSHGAAGIAWALFKLAEITGQERYSTIAYEAIAYERSLFSHEAKNWPDLRDFVVKNEVAGEHIYGATWCHGAPGIGLGHLDSLNYLDDPATYEEIEAALETTLAQGFGLSHSLCHGDLGNIELLLQASKTYNSPAIQAHVASLTSGILASIDTYGWLCGVPQATETPGLMLGLAGIGYGLLRLAQPEHVPAVLLLATPP